MIELDVEKVKKVELDILKYIKSVCGKNNLKYNLYGGTLAGAVFYKDYLPNDDDIDIALLREDYEKLISIIIKDDKYKILTPETDNNYFYPFAKVCDKTTLLVEKTVNRINNLGICIDIFPMDGLPRIFKKLFLYKMNIYKNLLLTNIVTKPKVFKPKHLYYLFKYYIIKLFKWFYRNKEHNYVAKKINKMSKRYNKKVNKYVSLVCYGQRNNNYIKQSDFLEQDSYYFVNDYYTSVKNSNMLLNKIYGTNYPKKSAKKHEFVAYKY